MLASSAVRARVALMVVASTLVATSCSPAGLRDEPRTIAVLKEIGAVTDQELRDVTTHGDGHIQGLDLMGKDISRVLPHLDGLKKLEGLDIDVRDYDVQEIEQLGKLKTLTHLVIGCRNEHLSVLQPLTNLTDLKILGVDIQDDSLRHLALMTGLQKLSLEGAPMDGSGFKYLKEFVELEELFVEGTNLNDEAISHIVENFPRLKRLEYQNTNVSREGALQLASLLWLLHPGFPREVLGPGAAGLSGEARRQRIQGRDHAKKAFAKEYLAMYVRAKQKARERGDEVPPDSVYPFAPMVALGDLEE